MPCTLVAAFPFACREGNGGMQEMKVKVFSESASGLTIVETSGIVTMSGSSLTGWYTYFCEKMTASGTEVGTTNVANGTTTFKPSITFIFNKLQTAFRNELKNLHWNRVHIAIKDNNGVAWLFGLTRGMDLPTSSSTTGTNQDDRSGYTLTFEGMESNPIVAISNYAALIT